MSIKLRNKRKEKKQIVVRASGVNEALAITAYDGVLCMPYFDINTEAGRRDYQQLKEIASSCYFWLINDDRDLDNWTAEEWNESIEKFSRKHGFQNERIKELSRNSIETYKKFL